MDDEYLWLEEVEGDEALAWATEQSRKTLDVFRAGTEYAAYKRAALEILEADDRIPFGVIRGEQVYNFWQDADHVRGLWRRVSRADYEDDDPPWETVIDLDQLAEIEGENWVWKGAAVTSDYSRAMIMLSRGGKDAVVVREFDLVGNEFVADGFGVPEAKTFVAWVDPDTLLVGTDFGEGSLTESGYPAVAKRWHRGHALDEATTVHEVDRSHVLLSPMVQHRPEGTYVALIDLPEFFTNEVNVLDGGLVPVGLPPDAQFQGFFHRRALAILRSDWRDFSQGSLVALDLDDDQASLVYEPDDRSSVSGAATAADAVVFAVLENVVGGLYVARLDDGAWNIEKVDIDGLGSVELMSASDDSSECFVAYNDFLTPPSLLSFSTADPSPRVLKSQPARFDAAGIDVIQCFATSADGTEVPYFLVTPQDHAGPGPTLLYGYGGFEIPLTPGYAALVGRLWLERGGSYAVANVRGGGEFGPAWHQAALKEHRHRAFEDFEAVAEDLKAGGHTTTDQLAIKGGSNGGLLVGSVMTRRPDLCAGVICAVPLLDMLRYHLLLAGASWVGEYGDPEDEEQARVLAGYSPFHQVRPDIDYPTVFFVTSTRDDRVHPGHARKMVARMLDQGHELYYYENTEGGHAAGANLKQHARLAALEYVYLDLVLTQPLST